VLWKWTLRAVGGELIGRLDKRNGAPYLLMDATCWEFGKIKFHLVEILGLNFVIRLSETDYKKEFCERKAHYQQTLKKIRRGRTVDVPLLIEGRSLRFIGTKNDSPEKPDDDLVLP